MVMMRGEEREEEEEREGGEEEGRRRREGGGVQNALDADGGPRVRDGLVERVLSWTAWQQHAPKRRTRASIRRGKGRPDDDGDVQEAEADAGGVAALRGLFLGRAWGLLLANGHMLIISETMCCLCVYGVVLVLGKGLLL